jgi:hypothetical protein
LPPGPWARSNQDKADLLASTSPKMFSLHFDNSDKVIDQELALPMLVKE